MTKVTVIGGGGTGHTLAADLSRRGHLVTLCEEPEYASSLESVKASGGVEISGALEPGFVALDTITTDIEHAVSSAEVILVSVIANRHESVARRIQSSLCDGQSIVIGPDNGGSLVFARTFRELGMTSRILLGGMGGNYYPCRLIGPASVYVGMPTGTKKVAAFPSKETAKLIASLDGLFDFVSGKNVLEMALSTPNIPNHLAGAILNTGAIESSDGKFNLFRDGLSPSVLRCIEAIVAERNTILRALEYDEINSPMLKKVAALDEHPELDMFRDLDGPSDMQHRYVTEDAVAGISLLVSLGCLLGVDTPVAEGLLSISSAINETDYLAEGRTLSVLGLHGKTIWEINHFLETGFTGEPPAIPPLM